MAGLLDAMDSDQFRLGLGLLAAGGARSDGAGFGQRVQEAFGGLDQYKRQKEVLQYEKLRNEQERRKVGQEDAQAKESARIRGLMANAGRGGMGATNLVNNALPADLRIGAMPALQVPGQIDYQDLIRQGVPLEQVKALAESRNFGRDKVARTADIEGPNGSKVVQGFDDYGQPVGQGAQGYVAPVQVNQGNKISFTKPTVGESFPIGMSPSERDSSARGWAANGIANQRLKFDQDNNQNGKAPAGYRWKQDGSMEAIPGGPADTKVGSVGAKATDARDALSIIAEAKAIIPKSTGSGLGANVDSISAYFGGSTEGAQAGAQLKALEGMLVAKMPKMTGPQSDKDVLLYKQMAGQVGDTSLPQQTRMSALNAIQRLQEQYAGGPLENNTPKPNTPTPPKPMLGMVRNGYKFKGGDPADQANWERQ